MFKTILVPLDGSTRAEQALPVAAHIARSSGGSIVLVRGGSRESRDSTPFCGISCGAAMTTGGREASSSALGEKGAWSFIIS